MLKFSGTGMCMALQYRFFSIPIPYGQEMEDSMNTFLRGVRLVHVHREIVCQDAGTIGRFLSNT
jgi:hypothetical protein